MIQRNDHRVISRSISTKVWDRAGIEQLLDLQSDSHLLPDTLPTALRGPALPFWFAKAMRRIKRIYFTAYVLIFKAILKCQFLRDNKFCFVKQELGRPTTYASILNVTC